MTWRVLKNEFGAEESWKLNYEVLESPVIYSWLKLTAGTEKLLPVQNAVCKCTSITATLLKPRLHDTTGCTTGLTTGCIV